MATPQPSALGSGQESGIPDGVARQPESAERCYAPVLTVKVFQTLEEVETLRDFWSTDPGTRDSDIDVLISVCRSSPDALTPHVIVLYRDGAPTALLAGRIVRRQLAFRVGYFNLFKPFVKMLTVPYGGLRGDPSPENCDRLVAEITHSLRRQEAEVALLEHVAKDVPLFRSAKDQPGLLFRDHFVHLRPHRKRILPRSVDQLNSELSGSERKRFRQIAKKLEKDFPKQVLLDHFENLDTLTRTLETVEGIAKKTWQRRFTGAFNTEGPLVDFFRTEAEKGYLRIYTLHLDGTPCAFWVGAVYQGTFFSDFLGYDPQYSRYSLGMFMLSRVMEEFAATGIREIDFGFTDDEYKRRFGNLTWQEASIFIFAPSLRGLKLSAMKATATMLHEPLRALLDRVNLMQRAKRIWRKVRGGHDSPKAE
jgi:hypothetical protein